MIRSTWLTEMIRKFASITQEGLSLQAIRDYGLKVGLVVEQSGRVKAAQLISIEVRPRTGKSSFVSIMVNLTLALCIQIVSVAKLTMSMLQERL